MFLLFLLLLCGNALADVYVVSNLDTKEVYSISDTNDAVVPKGFKVDTIKGVASEYLSAAQASDYKFTGKKLTLDVQKVNDREVAKAAIIDESKEVSLIENRAKKTACEALKADGVKLKKNCDDFK